MRFVQKVMRFVFFVGSLCGKLASFYKGGVYLEKAIYETCDGADSGAGLYGDAGRMRQQPGTGGNHCGTH